MVEAARDLKASIHERPEFMVRLLAVEGANPQVAEDIRANIHLDFPLSSFDLDLDALHKQVTELPPVQEATLRVRPGGVLEIGVVERVPALVWRNKEGLGLLDVDGVRITNIEARSDRPELPLVVGAGADKNVTEALDLVRAAAPIASRLRGLQRVGERRWDVVLDRNQIIQLPENGAVRALERVILLDSAQDLLARDVSHIDLRNARRPTLRLVPSSLEELRKIRGMELGVNFDE
ncbi:MAG: cell division protein FtsQ/DivIB [Pseudomonadota bacterium]